MFLPVYFFVSCISLTWKTYIITSNYLWLKDLWSLKFESQFKSDSIILRKEFLFCNICVHSYEENACTQESIQIYTRSHTTKVIPFHMINHHYAWKILTSAAFYSCQHNVVSKLNYYSYIHHLWTTQEKQQSSSESQSLSAAKWWIVATQKLLNRANGM